jgi:hypothetical protein
MDRRDLLKILGMAPLASALDRASGDLEKAASLVPHAQQPAAYSPKFFTPHEWRTVRLLADYVLPRDERSGSATDARVPEYMDYLLAERDASEASKVAMRGGLAWLDRECTRRFASSFIDSSDAQRRQVLDDIAWPRKAPAGMSYGVAFFNRFRDMTASGFYSSEMGWKDVRYIGNTFVREWKGCPPEALQKLGVSYDLMKARAPGDA